MVDVRKWQYDLEAARVRDQRELLSLGQRIESENAAINRELAQQGATIAEVLRVIHVRISPPAHSHLTTIPPVFTSHSLTVTVSQDINAGLQNVHFPPGTVKIAMPLSLSLDMGIRPTPRMNFDRGDNGSSGRHERPAHTAAAATATPLPRLVRSTKVPNAELGTPKSATRTPRHRDRPQTRRLSESLTKKCAKMVPLANVFSKLSSSRSRSISLPLRGAAVRSASSGSFCGRSPVAPRLKTISSVVCDDDDEEDEDDVRSSALSSPWYPLPADPPPPYQLRVANPEPECGCSSEGGTADVGHPSAASVTSSSRFTTASIEAVRAPDSPVPVFPSPKLSTDSVYGSIQSLASVSSGRSGASPGPHCRTRRNSAARPTGRVLRRRDTIKFARRVTMCSGHPSVEPPIIRPL